MPKRGSELFIILDMGASLAHTHHGRLIRSYCHILSSASQDFKVLIPMGSKIDNPCQNQKVSSILLPSYHPVPFQLTKPSSWIPTLTGIWIRHLYAHSRTLRLKLILSRIIYGFVGALIIVYFSRGYTKTKVIFPTACPASFWINSFLQRFKNKTYLYFRLTNTAERHAGFSKSFSLPKELEKAHDSQRAPTFIGIETNAYLKALGPSLKVHYLVPTPPLLSHRMQRESAILGSSGDVTIGFLGSPQSQKRLELLLEVVERTLVKENPTLHWILQLPNAAKGSFLLQSDSHRIRIHRGFLGEDIFDKSLASLDVLFLPYDAKIYRENASALMYRAADHGIPIICFRGSAFSQEVEEYKLGWVENSLDEVIETILNLQPGVRETFHQSFRAYNQFRLQANIQFLGIGENIET